jgi:hypothetical protein
MKYQPDDPQYDIFFVLNIVFAVWRSGADVTAELSPACFRRHKLQAQRKMKQDDFGIKWHAKFTR